MSENIPLYYRIVKNIKEVVQDKLLSKEEANYCMEFLTSNGMTDLQIEEVRREITGLGRDPDLHH